MAIMVSLIGVLVPAFSGIGKAGALNGDGALIANLANVARQNSLSKNAMTALVVVTDRSNDFQNRVFTMLELLPSSNGHPPVNTDWKQISKWETLGRGVVVNNWTTQSGTASTVSPALPPLTYGGQQIDQFKSLVFMPDGSTYGDGPTTVELVEGYYPKGAATPFYTGGLKNGSAANFYQLTILNATGRIKIDRP